MIRPSRLTKRILIAAIALSFAGSFAFGSGQKQIEDSMTKAVRYLEAQFDENGMCKWEYPKDHLFFGRKTSLIAYAMVTTGADSQKSPLNKTIDWLKKAELKNTYAVAFRAATFAGLKENQAGQYLERDVKWLLDAASDKGSYTHTSIGRKSADIYDNSNSQLALMGIWAGANRGIKIPWTYWKTAENHWRAQQQLDGGFGYRDLGASRKTSTYGSMTATGLVSLCICFDNLHQSGALQHNRSDEYEPIEKTLSWLDENFSIHKNPKTKGTWYYYWLYSIARAGEASGYKYFGGHDWFAEGTKELLRRQLSNGSWDRKEFLHRTAFALLFLAHGRNPVLANKLKYSGSWNPRPRDLANFSRFVSYDFEKPVSWQIANINATPEDWHDAPILYISGAGPVQFTDEQIEKLRTFVLQGGTIVSEAAGNNVEFTLDMQRACKKLFPEYQLQRLDDDHPIYSVHFKAGTLTGLLGVSNGVRLFAIHCPNEVSRALQLGPKKKNIPWFELFSNIYFYVTDKGMLRPRGTSPWPTATEFEPKANIRVVRVKYPGNFNPEPLAWKRLAIKMGNDFGISLEPSIPTEINKLNAADIPLAHMTGTDNFTLNQEQKQSLVKFFEDGGTLIIDAARGAKPFRDSVRDEIFSLVPDGIHGSVSTSVLYDGPAKLEQVKYRRDYAMSLGPARGEPQIEGVISNGRLAVIFSPADITAGLVGYHCYGIKGYTSETAYSLITNILYNLASLNSPEAED